MEYIRPLSAPSLVQRVRLFLLDLVVVLAVVRRFLLDHLGDPSSPLPQAINQAPGFVPFYARDNTRAQTSTASGARSTATEKAAASPAPSSIRSDDVTSVKPTVTVPTAAAVPAGPPYQLRILSLNVWGLPISPKTTLRACELSKSFHLYDLIALQEGSHEREMRIMEQSAREAGLHYSHQFTIGVGFPLWHGLTAPGLVVFSRFPIIDMNFKRYCINGKMYQLHHSDYMLAKGVALVRVDVSALAYPNAAPGDCRPVVGVDVFLTHLHANYTNWFYDWRKWLPLMTELEARLDAGEGVAALKHLMPIPLLEHVHDEYLAHRVLQAYECAKFIAAFRRPDFLTVLAGDLNCPPYDLCLQVIQALTFGQDAGCRPRFTDAFHELHPNSQGFTCGAEDNTFTFSQQPVRMERRAVACQSAQSSLVRSNSTPPRSDSSSSGSGSVSGSVSGSAGDVVAPMHPPVYAAQLRKREQYNSSPQCALVPADAEQRASRTTYGEHATFLPSSAIVSSFPPVDASSSAAKAAAAASSSAAAFSPSPSTGVDTAASSPLAWIDENLPKRIDYVLYAQPARPMQCACAFSLLQLPFHSVTRAEQATVSSTCRCPPPPLPEHTWRNVRAAVFKQYILEPTGEVTSISDHHGIAVTFELTPSGAAVPAAGEAGVKGKLSVQASPFPTQPDPRTSITLFSKRALQPGESTADAGSTSSTPTPQLKLKLMAGESQLYTLEDSDSPPPSSPVSVSRARLSPATSHATMSPARTPSPSEDGGASCSYGGGLYSTSSASTPAVGDVPALPTATLLLLCEGVMWFGLRDATDRRRAHMRRSLQSFVIFALGSRSLWVWVLDRYFETVLADILPAAVWHFPLPSGLLLCMRLLLLVVDWLHSSLPIFIVLLWLCTTFPAKEEQMCLREAIQEMTKLRQHSVNFTRQAKLATPPPPISKGASGDQQEDSSQGSSPR